MDNKKSIIICGIIVLVIIALIVGVKIKKSNSEKAEIEETISDIKDEEQNVIQDETHEVEQNENQNSTNNKETNASKNETVNEHIEENKTENKNENKINNKAENKTNNSNTASKNENIAKGQEESITEQEKGGNSSNNESDREKALRLVKQEWGEDDTVYYTIDNQKNNIYNISVRRKSDTAAIAEYEVDVKAETVIIL